MNYRHGFHAGNFADVHKHVVMVAILEYLLRKETPFCVLDTHAARGSYDLTQGQAARTGEWEEGIGRLWKAEGAPPRVARYLDLVRQFNLERTGEDKLTAYPGSPRLARQLMRPQDRLIACELHPDECALLKAEFHRDPLTAIHARDAWEALNALLPLKIKRGLVLIDPPYEAQEEELKLAANAVRDAVQKFPTGIFALWYPIKEREPIDRLHRNVTRMNLGNVFACELCVWPDEGREHLNGSGMLIVNPPWQLDAQLTTDLRWLWPRLNHDGQGRHTLKWLSRRE